MLNWGSLIFTYMSYAIDYIPIVTFIHIVRFVASYFLYLELSDLLIYLF